MKKQINYLLSIIRNKLMKSPIVRFNIDDMENYTIAY